MKIKYEQPTIELLDFFTENVLNESTYQEVIGGENLPGSWGDL